MNIIVRVKSRTATAGVLEMDGHLYSCTIGRAGVVRAEDKREGDGKTPLGSYPLRQLIYRADRVAKPKTNLPTEILTETTGWCEDPTHADYNRKITLPHPSVHDRMMRDDNLYDYTVVVGYNDDPVMPGRGSAIFMHLAHPDGTPTAGCVGLKPEDMKEVLARCNQNTRIEIMLTS